MRRSRKEFLDAIDRVIGDMLADVAKIRLRIHAVELGCSDQVVSRSGTLASGIGAAEQIVFSFQGYGSQRQLGGVVVDLDASVGAVAGQGNPTREHVADRLGELGFLR